LVSDLAAETIAMVIQEFPGCYNIQCPIRDTVFLFNVELIRLYEGCTLYLSVTVLQNKSSPNCNTLFVDGFGYNVEVALKEDISINSHNVGAHGSIVG
jgi:hypothetical protein